MPITKDNVKRAKRLVKRLEKVDKKLDKLINIIATTDKTSNVFWRRMDAKIRKQYEIARRISRDWTTSNIPAVYAETLNKQLQSIKSKKIPGIKKLNFNSFANTAVNKQSVSSLITETLSTYGLGFDSGQKTMLRLSSLTQQLNVEEKAIEKSISSGFLEKGTVNESKKRVQKELLKKSLDGKYITIINKNGKPERWKISTYSELVARTKLQETFTQGVVNTTVAVGGDLVQVSSHNTQTPFDAQFEGKIFSLTGNDPDFPRATLLPPFHPNCLHSISTTFKIALARTGVLQKSIDFANGKSFVHPTRKSHIPINKRRKSA